MTTEKPKDCPFCGAEMEGGAPWKHPKSWSCMVATATVRDHHDLAAWNRRAPDAQVRPIGNEALDERTKRVIAELEKLIKDLDLPEPALIAEMSELGYAARIMPLPDYGIMLIRRTVRRALDAELRVIAATARADEAERQRDAMAKARPEAEWHEDIGPVLWWKFPIDEAPWVGSPLWEDWPGHHTHWTPLRWLTPDQPSASSETEQR